MISKRNLEVPMPRVEARQKIRDRGEAEAITTRPRQDRGEAPNRRGEAEAASRRDSCLETYMKEYEAFKRKQLGFV